MRHRPNTMETVKLALELLRRIPARRKITAEQLHAQLADAGIKRDLRSIQRQLKALSDHFDIECDDSDLADALEVADEEGVGAQKLARACTFDVPLLEARVQFLDERRLLGGDLDGLAGVRFLKSQPAVIARAQAMVVEDLLHGDR